MRALLLALRDRDPQGWESRAPTDAEVAAYYREIAENHGTVVLERYLSNWE